MAGSLHHIIDKDGRFDMDMIENMGDAYEALEDCFGIIYHLSGGDKALVDEALSSMGFRPLDRAMDITEEDWS